MHPQNIIKFFFVSSLPVPVEPAMQAGHKTSGPSGRPALQLARQSASQSVNQSINQSINQPIN